LHAYNLFDLDHVHCPNNGIGEGLDTEIHPAGGLQELFLVVFAQVDMHG
jgi:hypothetical protein